MDNKDKENKKILKKMNQEKVKQDYISSKKKKLENSYIYSQKTKDMKP